MGWLKIPFNLFEFLNPIIHADFIFFLRHIYIQFTTETENNICLFLAFRTIVIYFRPFYCEIARKKEIAKKCPLENTQGLPITPFNIGRSIIIDKHRQKNGKQQMP